MGKKPDAQTVLQVQQIIPIQPIPDGNFTVEEYKKVKNSIQEGKAPGPDGIPPEVFKRCNVDELIVLQNIIIILTINLRNVFVKT